MPTGNRQEQPTKRTESAKDPHKEVPEQRADWEGMAPTTPQRGSDARADSASRDEQHAGDESDEDASRLEGEGSYRGTRKYNQGLAESIAEGKTEERARAAEQALEGPEGEELRRAEKIGKSGKPAHKSKSS